MIYTFIYRRCGDLPVGTCCRVMGVSTSGFYAWRACPVSDRDWDDAVLTNQILDIHRASRRSYGSPRVHDELRLGEGIRCSRKRVERLMRQAGIQGIYRRKRRGCTRRDPDATPSADLVNRAFDPPEPDRLWLMDITEHPTGDGKVYLAVVLDAFSRMVIGWSIADHIRSELVVDALEMARWRRRPPTGLTIAHSDHGAQRRAQPIVATPPCWADCRYSSRASAGVFQPRVLRGLLLSVSATASISSAFQRDRSVPLGKYWRSSPLVFSLVPRCQGLCGSAK
jgi:HTH-like domain/Integrase core domain